MRRKKNERIGAEGGGRGNEEGRRTNERRRDEEELAAGAVGGALVMDGKQEQGWVQNAKGIPFL